MPNLSFHRPNSRVKQMTSAAMILENCHRQLDVLVTELKPERGVKGALADIADEAGLPYSKVRRIFYRLTQNILAFERDRLEVALKKLSLDQEARIETRLNNIRSLRAEGQLLERQFGMDR